MKLKTILASGYFSGDAQKRKIEFFERMDLRLRSVGYRLLLVNIGLGRYETACDTVTCPRSASIEHHVHGREFLHIEDLPAEIILAATVEAETRQSGLVGACLRLSLYHSFMKQVLEQQEPVLCLIWHQFNGSHHTLSYLCRTLEVPFLYTEYGALPGTVSFDELGQMAESWVAQRHLEFTKLPIDDSDLATADRFIDYLREHRKSGKPQGEAVAIAPLVARARERGRKVVFYAGQNDWASGLLPRSFPDSRMHSPFYDDTLHALCHLSELAEENDWQVLFKPHPLVEDRHVDFTVPFPGRVDLVVGANILDCMNQADVTTTILSQVSYLALIHERPCVMLGRNQLRGKGCTNQPGALDEVADAIESAIRDGFLEKQAELWQKHVAQICRYYLFAMGDEVAAIIGRDVEGAADFLIAQAKKSRGAKGESEAVEFLVRLPLHLRVKHQVVHVLRNVETRLPRPVHSRLQTIYRRYFKKTT